MKRKKIISVLMSVFMVACMAITFCACGLSNYNFSAHKHIDVYGSGYCDTCGKVLSADENSVTPIERPTKPVPGGEDEPPIITPPHDDPITDKPVATISVKSSPKKVEYFEGEEFVADGGVLTVKYTDRTTAELPFTAKGVQIEEVNTSTAGEKTVTVRYGSKRVTFNISVVKVGAIVTLDMNYDGATNTEVKIAEGRAISKPSDPEREGYSFYKWYEDKNCTIEYIFSTKKILTGNCTLYAEWKGEGDNEVIYDLNYYGKAVSRFPQIVKNGQGAKSIPDPVRESFRFEGWYSDEALTQKYSAGTAITSDTVLRAKWTKLISGTNEYIFEAENTDLTGKQGPGFSGEFLGTQMILTDSGSFGASNGKYISYLYKNGLGLEFYIASDEAVSNATLTVRIALDNEFENAMTLSDKDWQIIVNGKALDFGSVTLSESKFKDMIVINNVSLEKGANVIRLLTSNSRNPLGNAGTYSGSAPIVDCIKINTSSVLAWDENYGLPANV